MGEQIKRGVYKRPRIKIQKKRKEGNREKTWKDYLNIFLFRVVLLLPSSKCAEETASVMVFDVAEGS